MIPAGSRALQAQIWTWLLAAAAGDRRVFGTGGTGSLDEVVTVTAPAMPADAAPGTARRALWLAEAALRAIGGEDRAPQASWGPLVALQEAQMPPRPGWPGPMPPAAGLKAVVGPGGLGVVLAEALWPQLAGRAVPLLPAAETADAVARRVLERYWLRRARELPAPPVPPRPGMSWLVVAALGVTGVLVLRRRRR